MTQWSRLKHICNIIL